MRVITGSARGRLLKTLKGEATRPTAQRVKEAIFSAIQFEIEGRRVLDLFAGSGQMGIEALSRGAASAVFADAARPAVQVIIENVTACGFGDRSRILCRDAFSALAALDHPVDLVFLDPPYGLNLLPDLLPNLLPRLSSYATVVCEHASHQVLPASFGGWSADKTRRYGNVSVTIYRNR